MTPIVWFFGGIIGGLTLAAAAFTWFLWRALPNLPRYWP